MDLMLSELSPPARQGIRKFLDALDWGDEPSFEQIAWVWFLMRQATDHPEWFPRGKWATIQRLESLLLLEAAKCCARR